MGRPPELPPLSVGVGAGISAPLRSPDLGLPAAEPNLRDLAIIIVSYNTALLLRQCLRALRASLARGSSIQADVVVVDNASTDGSPDLVRREFPEVSLIQLDENRGFAAANNLGIRQTNARYVWLLNPDTEPLADAPAALVHFMDEHPRAGGCGARLLNPDLTFQHSAFRFPNLAMSFVDFFPINHRLVNSRLNGRYPRAWYTRPFPIDHPLGADLLVRRDAVEQVGLLDEGYFMYCEEVDWCFRLKQAGWEIFYTPAAEVIHHGGASTRQVRGPMFVELHRSRDRFFRRHYGETFAWLAAQIVRLGLLRDKRRLRQAAARAELAADDLRDRLATLDAVLA
jgi:GT2 family glycosyltransferase